MKWLISLVAILLVIILLKFGELATQSARYHGFWQRHNQETLANSRVESVRYYALGDSTAQGIGASSPKNSYPMLVAEAINEKHGNVELVNLSKSGAKVNDVLAEQVPVMKSLGVKENSVVTVSVGANDMASFDKAKFEKDMDELMKQLPEQTIIADVPSFSGGRNAKLERNVLEANEILVRLSDKYGLKRALLYDRTSSNQNFKMVAIDRFHPSDKGYRENWAPVFIEQL